MMSFMNLIRKRINKLSSYSINFIKTQKMKRGIFGNAADFFSNLKLYWGIGHKLGRSLVAANINKYKFWNFEV